MWYDVQNADQIPSPALIVDEDRVRANIRYMIDIARGTERLCPHVKTHKMAEVTRLYQAAGVNAFKCATIAEAEMLGCCTAGFAMLAYQPVGPAIGRLLTLATRFPATRFATIIDCPAVLQQLASAVRSQTDPPSLEVLLDVDVGMHRTGIGVGPAALELYQQICATPGISAGGLHVYDGHIHDADLPTRTARVEQAFAPVADFFGQLQAANLPVRRIVAGGSLSFPIHCQHADRWCSPGTGVFWDAGYSKICPDLSFQPAAWLLCRVISKPGPGLVCIDLGYKAIASESPAPRATFPQWPDAVQVGHSEEHLVLEFLGADQLAVGDIVYAIPKHICPTVALHQQAYVVQNGRFQANWSVTARDRTLNV